jgi:DUF4097 and DUF4098 domain-containing protein YvlB
MTTRHLLLIPILISCASSSNIIAKEGTVYETIEKSFKVSSGGSLSLENTNGWVDVTSWDKDRVEVIAEKDASAPTEAEARRLLEETEVRATQTGNHITIKTKRKDWSLGGKRRLHINYKVKVPRRFNVSAETVNGSVDVEEISGSVEAKTVNGNVDMESIRGSFNASSVNGAIRADLTQIEESHDLSAHTVNGSLTITLPKNVKADLRAKTLNGSINSDFELSVKGRIGKRVSGKINGGGPELHLQTLNGSIRIRKQQN